MTKPTGQVAAGFKAAHTRKIKMLTEQVSTGKITKTSAAGFKAAATRKLQAQLAGASAA